MSETKTVIISSVVNDWYSEGDIYSVKDASDNPNYYVVSRGSSVWKRVLKSHTEPFTYTNKPEPKQISHEDFDNMVKDLAERNWKVRNFLRDFGSYEKLPQNLKDLLDKEFGITRKVTVELFMEA